eukprot:757881-Hanusia_phi.AAC.3
MSASLHPLVSSLPCVQGSECRASAASPVPPSHPSGCEHLRHTCFSSLARCLSSIKACSSFYNQYSSERQPTGFPEATHIVFARSATGAAVPWSMRKVPLQPAACAPQPHDEVVRLYH